ncbi:hypothetical protein [Sorangium sp. So ce341]|uniref:hypothetical protein n=1 Tax=Sorangium sp. So ce341 TaxID=3133302 RepID=UPI003F605FF3
MTDRVFVLPHSAAERLPHKKSSRCDWPLAHEAHARKFIEVNGQWLSGLDSRPSRGNIRIWCEYEAPTTVTPIHPAHSEHPTFLHHIDVSALHAVASARMSRRHLNTDPWIWDDGFVWSVCKHFTPKRNFRADVANLKSGDVVLFGSSINGNWVLDTVFVAASQPIPYKYPHIANPALSPAYRECVSEPLSIHRLPLRIALGAPYRAGQRLFSFAPGIPSTQGMSFPRVDISNIIRKIRLNNGQLAKPSNRQALASGTYPGGNGRLWHELANMTFDAGLVLGFSFEHPYEARNPTSKQADALHTTGPACSGRAS